MRGVGANRLAGDVDPGEEGNEHPDLVGLFDLIGARYRQSGDFFWVWQILLACPTALRI